MLKVCLLVDENADLEMTTNLSRLVNSYLRGKAEYSVATHLLISMVKPGLNYLFFSKTTFNSKSNF